MKIKTVKYSINLSYINYHYRPITGITLYNVKRSTGAFYPKKDEADYSSYYKYYYDTTKYPDIYCVYRLYKNADILLEYAFMSDWQYLDIKIKASL